MQIASASASSFSMKKFGLECILSKGLCFLGFELWECEKVKLQSQPNKANLDWNALPARVSAFWVFELWEYEKVWLQTQANKAKSVTVWSMTCKQVLLDCPNNLAAFPSEQGQVSDCVVNDMQTSAAGLSQCIIMDILNDVMQFGLEFYASKGLCFLGFEIWEFERIWLRSHLNKAKSVTVWSMTCTSVLLDCPNFGLECFAGKGLCFLGIELWEYEKVWLRSQENKANLDWNALPARVSAFSVLSSGSVKKSGCGPIRKQGQFIKYVINDMQTSAAGLLDWNSMPARVSVFWVLSSGSVKKSGCGPNQTRPSHQICVWIGMLCQQGSLLSGYLSSGSVKKCDCGPRKQGQFIKYVVNDMHISAAGLSQCIIMDILNDIMQFGLECFASKGLCFLGFELLKCEKVWLRPQLNKAKSVTVWSMTCKPVLLDYPNVSLWIY
eukprot:scaffold39963_cov61-Cyclotella_meneghiniana.AAC.1